MLGIWPSWPSSLYEISPSMLRRSEQQLPARARVSRATSSKRCARGCRERGPKPEKPKKPWVFKKPVASLSFLLFIFFSLSYILYLYILVYIIYIYNILRLYTLGLILYSLYSLFFCFFLSLLSLFLKFVRIRSYQFVFVRMAPLPPSRLSLTISGYNVV